ncbi:hypothetical protein RhiirA5_437426 [Rhizophagus irregularis]|uniref:Uncharacterized protein n=1 Tax=Rhizophagus irregularis TaxID=588596 RepID=A0A2N0NKI6_9GLOM|nr:hypothetical protein RhiirA5_437426 [Rhizophagus irregularis]
MLYMKDLLALSRFRFTSLLTDSSQYMNVSRHHTLKFQLFLEDLLTLELLKRT